MGITLEQIEKDIAEKKSDKIYFSANTLWWTHLASDVEEATKHARAVMKLRHDALMKSDMPKAEKKKADYLYKMASQHNTLPLDPSGSPLMQMPHPEKWVTEPRNNLDHYGKYKLKAFVKTHHQNCDNVCFTGWDNVNEAIDKELEKEEKEKKDK